MRLVTTVNDPAAIRTMRWRIILGCVMVALVSLARIEAQWVNYPTRGVPRCLIASPTPAGEFLDLGAKLPGGTTHGVHQAVDGDPPAAHRR